MLVTNAFETHPVMHYRMRWRGRCAGLRRVAAQVYAR